MPETTSAIPAGGDAPLADLENVPGGELPSTDPDAESALDSLLKQVQTDEVEPEAASQATTEPVKAETPATPEAVSETEPVKTEPAKTEPAETPAATSAEDEFDKIQLPPYTKPKSAEAFAEVKAIARQRISSMEKELSELREKLKSSEELAKNGLTPEQKAEFEELRNFKLQMDVEADPSWKEFNSRIKENDQLIYKKLRDSGASDEQIQRIEELGGPNEVDWDSISDRLPAPVKRFIDAKLVENEDLEAKKSLSKESAKKNAAEYLKSREASFRSSVDSELKSILPSIPWMKEKPVTGTEAEKSAAQAHNKLLQDIQANVQEAVSDDSPKMKALLVAGFAQFIKTRADALALKAELDSLKANSAKEIDTLKASLKEKEDFISKVKKASTSRIGGSAPSPESRPTKVDPNVSPSEHLDRLLAEAQSA